MIVTAFASGDRIALRGLLSDDTYRAFEQAISAREKEGETQVSEIKSMRLVQAQSVGDSLALLTYQSG